MSEWKPIKTAPRGWLYEWARADGTKRIRFSQWPREGHEDIPLYTQTAIESAVAAERERCAKLCAQKAEEWMARAEAGNMNRDTARHAHIAAGQIEAAIRGT